jgi:ArsR family transcriptional regulator, arsenate/arsenite/antimonite-responsive transcriptional repressor
MRELIKAAKALSDETRLRILNLLLNRECCVCEVMQVLNITQTRASRNLNILHDAGFLIVRREGLWAYYSINKDEPEVYLSLLLSAVKRELSRNTVAVKDRKSLKDAHRLGPQCCSPLPNMAKNQAVSDTVGEK